MTVLTNEQLDDLCLLLKNYDSYYWSECNIFLDDLYYTGCRSQELFRINRWFVSGVNTVGLLPFKGNNTRTFFDDFLSVNLNEAIVNQVKPYNGLTLRQLMFEINRVNPYGQIYVEDKPMDAYIFRYNAVKKMVADGIDYDEIKDFFGWTTTAMINQYNSAQLYYI